MNLGNQVQVYGGCAVPTSPSKCPQKEAFIIQNFSPSMMWTKPDSKLKFWWTEHQDLGRPWILYFRSSGKKEARIVPNWVAISWGLIQMTPSSLPVWEIWGFLGFLCKDWTFEFKLAHAPPPVLSGIWGWLPGGWLQKIWVHGQCLSKQCVRRTRRLGRRWGLEQRMV